MAPSNDALMRKAAAGDLRPDNPEAASRMNRIGGAGSQFKKIDIRNKKRKKKLNDK